jgi:hypothetical protein
MMSLSAVQLSMILAVSAYLCTPAYGQEPTVPTGYGWLLSSGFDSLPVEGKVAPIGADRKWRGGLGLPANDFNYLPPMPEAKT